MLVLSRKAVPDRDTIDISMMSPDGKTEIKMQIVLLQIRGKTARIGFIADEQVRVLRNELPLEEERVAV